MRRRGLRTSAVLAVLAVALLLSGCGLTSTPAPGWVWPTTGPVTPAPTPLRVTPAVLPTATARHLSPATAVAVAPTSTVTDTPTELPVATETPTALPTYTAVPPTETVVPPTETPLPPTETALPPTETPAPPPTDTPVSPTATVVPPTSTPVRGKIIRRPGGVATAVATAVGPLPVDIVPTPTAAPTPAFPIAEQFRSAWRDYPAQYGELVRANSLGQPLEAPWSEQASRQFFAAYQSGPCAAGAALFLWRESTDEILFLVADNAPAESQCLDRWDAYPDTWATGQGNNEDLVPPEGRYTPVMGFGRVWREYFYGRSDGGLGFAVTPEQYTTATVQRFENGTALHFSDTNEVYVLFNEYRAVGPGGEYAYRAWFRNP